MGLSENSVPLNPMVLLIIIPMKNCYFIGNINPTFSDKPTPTEPGTSPLLAASHCRGGEGHLSRVPGIQAAHHLCS